jgi:hypothetical protein
MVNSKFAVVKNIGYAILIFAFCILNFMGCATYKFQRGSEPPYNKGYVALRDDRVIPEYTIGKDNSVPDLELAKERFQRRRDTVEYYYKKMGSIENHLKMFLWDPPVMLVKVIGGVFQLPFIAISDYRYQHNPAYKERVRKIEEERDAREETRIKKLKDELDVYIQKDLASEPATATMLASEAKTAQPVEELVHEMPEGIKKEVAETKPEPQPVSQVELTQPSEKEAVVPTQLPAPQVKLEKQTEEVIPPEQPTPILQTELVQGKEPPKAIVKERARPLVAPRQKPIGQVVAKIIAKPAKGFSPLRVQFYGHKSYAPQGKIISYSWDFGDGDASTKPNPVNTYWSATFMPQYFTVTLTVQDNRGNTAKDSITIEVLNK